MARNAIIAALIGLVTVCRASAQGQSTAPATQLAMPRVAIVRVYVADLAKGEEFYRSVFGLKPGRGSNERERVLAFADSSSPVIIVAHASAVPATPDGMAPFAIVVHDFSDLLKRVAAAGGTIAQSPRSIGTDGQFAVIRDLYGNQIEIIGAPG